MEAQLTVRARLSLRNDKMLSARKRLGLTQQAVADVAGCNVADVGNLERLAWGDTPKSTRHQTASAIAGVLDLPIDEVLPPGLENKVIPNELESVRNVPVTSLLAAATAARKRLQAPDPAVAAEQSELREMIAKLLKTLTYREREIIKLRYGIGDGLTYSLEEVGRRFRVTRECVRQIEDKAIRKLRHPLRSRPLKRCAF